MRLPILVALVLVALVLVVAGFLLGWFYAGWTMESRTGPRFRLKDEMIILSADAEPRGKLPAGTVVYLVPDPFGDRTTLYKAYFQTYVHDMAPIERIREEPTHRYEQKRYGLKPRQWLESLTEKESRPEEGGGDTNP